ncbi:fibronectin type III domain-containing protein 7-like [Dunckerocampus dactyliophorus]|uniref:fibronectin type III domain-containing protein 7-like n=1 Tax=Dunckerocampus dactyliophorus TaxID=161453 RepID=UPI00240549DF|nr:fibronectin type III domain-containing protein 7-like [Dunckerocampus dactyliophorus]
MQSCRKFPCTPTIVSVSAECSQESARINWTTSIGAIFYIAVVQDLDGNLHSCSSGGTDCLVEGLRCAQNYTAHVTGTNLKCNSSTSEEIAFSTAPCPPDNIEAFRDCDANHALIVWQNHQSTGIYTATIEDQSGAQLTCNSNTVNNCKIRDLPCGKTYSVTVTNSDESCLSTSTPISMDSVPCGPEDVEASIDCATGKLTMTWNITIPAENYTATISRGMGQPIHCNSTETQCTTGGLACGSTYSVTVMSVTGSCFSLPSPEATVQTLPCPPTGVTVETTCTSSAPVSWVASNSAEYYTAFAVSGSGHTLECTTNETLCNLYGLRCGEVYTIGVAGVNDNCTGLQGDTVELYTVPCSPTNVSSQLDCLAGTAHLSWAPSPNAVDYVAVINNTEVSHSCFSLTANCTINNLLCDNSYEIFVDTHDGNCVSPFSSPQRLGPGPCDPVNVTTVLQCGSDAATVSWNASAGATAYTVLAYKYGSQYQASCWAMATSCQLDGLQCGAIYNLTVLAEDTTCNSTGENTTILMTGNHKSIPP